LGAGAHRRSLGCARDDKREGSASRDTLAHLREKVCALSALRGRYTKPHKLYANDEPTLPFKSIALKSSNAERPANVDSGVSCNQ
jgi:hypothetical protein